MFAFRDGIDVALGDKVCACATGAMRRWHWGSAMRIRRPGHLACTGHGLAFVQGMALFSQLGKSVVCFSWWGGWGGRAYFISRTPGVGHSKLWPGQLTPDLRVPLSSLLHDVPYIACLKVPYFSV